MKIGLVVPGFSASEADWCIPALLDIVRKFAEKHEVHVFTLRHPPEKRTYSIYGSTVHALGGGEASGLRRIPLLVRGAASILAESRRAPFDVIHGLWADEPGFVALVAGRILSVPVVVSLMGGELVSIPEIEYGHQRSLSARWMIWSSLRFADRVTVGSMMLYMQAMHHLREDKLVYAPLGVDLELFSPSRSRLQANGFNLLHVASLNPVKNQHMLLKSFAEVRHAVPDAHLHIVGDGSLRPAIKQRIKTLGIETRVTLHGEVSHERLPEYYRAADLCVLTSHHESQGMVALEAALCGCMTVGTHVGILPELVSDEYLVSSDDSQMLAQIIIRLAQDTTLRAQLENDIQQKVTTEYSLDAAVDRWLKIYNRLGM